jgi:hypothetical protein
MVWQDERLLEMMSIGQLVVDRVLGLTDNSDELLMTIALQSQREATGGFERHVSPGNFSYGEAALLFLTMQEAADDPNYPNLTALWHEWQRRGRQRIRERDPELHRRMQGAVDELAEGEER